jgi:hypothetical protein
MNEKKKRQPHKKHWYKQFTTECPLCGRGETIRERVYGEKPKNPEEMYSFESYYDSCMAY